MADDDFTLPVNDGLNVSRLVRRDVQIGVAPASLIPSVIADFRAQHGLSDEAVLNAVVVKQFRQEPESGVYKVVYRITGTVPPPPPSQTASVEFQLAGQVVPGDIPSVVTINVVLTTSDGLPLVSLVSLDVRDLLTGNAVTPLDYSFPTPTSISFAPGSLNGSVLPATLTTTGVNSAPDRNVNLDIDPGTIVGAIIGPQGTHNVLILNIAA